MTRLLAAIVVVLVLAPTVAYSASSLLGLPAAEAQALASAVGAFIGTQVYAARGMRKHERTCSSFTPTPAQEP